MRDLLAVLLVVVAGLPAHAIATPTSLFVFGDSLADAGNNAVVFDTQFGVPPGTLRTATPIASPAFIPDFPYASNRYSNGPVWVEHLAAGLGVSGGATASLLGGTNFAFGGARTAFSPTAAPFPPSLEGQVGGFLAASPSGVPSSALYVVQGGGNDARDIFAAAFPIALTGGNPSSLIATRSAQYADDVASLLLDLQSAGARKFLGGQCSGSWRYTSDQGIRTGGRGFGDVHCHGNERRAGGRARRPARFGEQPLPA